MDRGQYDARRAELMPGFPLVKWWALRLPMIDPRLRSASKDLFFTMLYYHNSKTGCCFLGRPRLADDLGCLVRSIGTGLNELKTYGYVRIVGRFGGSGVNQYDLSIPTGKKAFDTEEKKRRAMGKGSSPKQMNELMKEQCAMPKAPQASYKWARRSANQTSQSEKIGWLQKSVADELGGNDDAWEQLMNLDCKTREEIEIGYANGAFSLGKAKRQYVNAIRLIGTDGLGELGEQ